MTLFQQPDDYSLRERDERMPRGKRVGWWLLTASVVALLILGFAPSPYVIEQPGPVFNTLGVDTAIGASGEGATKPVLTISGAKTYATKGALDLLTVNVVGNPQQLPSWFQVAEAWFEKSKAIVPVEVEFPAGQTSQEADQENAQEMSSSQQDATAAALNELGYDFTQTVVIAGVESGTPADGKLKANDQLKSVDGTAVHGVQALRDAVQKSGGKPVDLEIVRSGTTRHVTITPFKSDGAWTLGVYAGMQYGTMPVKVDFQLADIGGPSAGQMFALGIIDKLTPGYLNGGKKVAGTGTIDNEGDVGAIGGIRQKMYGARAAGATVFLAPESNCDEVVGHIPDGLHVYAVSTLDDSLKVLKAVSAGTGTESLPTCHR
ncbi:YlbL family protein [Gryllotalpicola ginsengisoli]|uniref:YlbL family protein n=1 Tax=Gryllotalpicola ginsengisoli TaxID=444608 RepID=UPI0003B77A89|nr:S16 family serine protease [Gryllotalpicola ginsengisoli]